MSTIGGGLRKSTRKAKDYMVVVENAPENNDGVYIKHADVGKKAPKDYLMIARVVKRNTTPLTIAEINIKTKEVLLASAKRHSFILQNGKIEIISGDKRAIGGAHILKTPFQLLRFKMAENDALFIFSDGYPDQFGGEDGRKLKLSGTSEILSKLNELPKDEYSKRVKSAFEQWQGDYDQIDDVLFMGILF